MERWDSLTLKSQTGLAAADPMFLRMRAPIPAEHLGADVRLYGSCDDGFFYYCKGDNGLCPVRATEALGASLAEHLGIAAAPWGPVEVDGEVLFGSKRHPSTEEQSAVQSFCMTPEKDEIGARLPWRGSYFARLYVLDSFLGNIDRQARNLVAYREGRTMHVRAIDFAASNLLAHPGIDIQLNGSQTQLFGRIMRGVHGDGGDAANEMVERLSSVPVSFVKSVLDRLPSGWLDAGQACRFVEFWSGDERTKRLARLGAGLKDGSLL